jgi:hypothetical protein
MTETGHGEEVAVGTRWHTIALPQWLVLVVLWACGSNSTAPLGTIEAGPDDAGNDSRTGADATEDGTGASGDAMVHLDGISSDVVLAEGGGVCCPPSNSPACCMSFGGWASSSVGCGQLCDGFRLPTTLSKDAHGCDLWTGAAGPICGAASPGPDATAGASDGSTPDGGADNAASDASCGDIFLSSLDKTCTRDSDCTMANHSDCCGTVVVGIHIGTDTTFTSAESAFQACVPGCGLRGCSHATWAETGPPGPDAGTIVAYCAMGACTTRFQ